MIESKQKQVSPCGNYNYCSENLAACAKRGMVETGKGVKGDHATMCEQCIQTMDHMNNRAILIIVSK